MTKNKYFPHLTVRDVPIAGETVLLRADYNVPLTDEGKIDSDYRISQSLPTLRYLLGKKCKIIICSHLGRPDGKVNPEFSLEPIAKHLADLLDEKVAFVTDCVGDKAKQGVKRATSQIIMLENLRFHPEEEANDPDFAKRLRQVSGAKYFVQDGFGVVHRAHASTSAITMELPSVAGLLLEKEVATIDKAMSNPERPLVAILGGAKISDKLVLIDKFVAIADKILIGGAMANTFLQYYGLPVGKSLWEDGLQTDIQRIADLVASKEGLQTEDCPHNGPKPCLLCSQIFRLPTDVAVGLDTSQHSHRNTLPVTEVTSDDMILDIGEQTISSYRSELESANTVIWNGTMGFAELPQFATGSSEIANSLRHHSEKCESIIGGGDTADFILKWNAGKTTGFSHISTGGGASLELMAGMKLPGIEALLKC